MYISSYQVVCTNCGVKLRDGVQEYAEYCDECRHYRTESQKVLDDINKKEDGKYTRTN